MKKFILLAFLALPAYSQTIPLQTVREGVGRGYLPTWLTYRDYIQFRFMYGETYACITDFETGAHWITHTDTQKIYTYFRTLQWNWAPKTPLTKADLEVCRFSQ